MKRILTFIAFLFVLQTALGQKTRISKTSYLNEYLVFKPEDKNLTPKLFFELHKTVMGLGEDDRVLFVSETKGKNNFNHLRYAFTYKGLPVDGCQYILHTKDGLVESANGNYLPKIDVEIKPVITSADALARAIKDMDAELYAWEDNATKGHFGKPNPELVVIDKAFPRITGEYVLAYKLDLRSQIPLDAQTYYISAKDGSIIKKIELHASHTVPGTGQTRYLGEQSFMVDSLGPEEFVLRDSSRTDGGIVVYDGEIGNVFTSTSSHFDLTNEDMDEVAIDAHYLTSEYYDLLRDEFDWLGLDNSNLAMEVIVHERAGTDFVNAFWDGTHAHFGDGNCNNGPLVTAEVLAHEFMHGIIDYTSNLIYADESGAINESMADVMGHYMEYVIDEENFSWELGPSFHLQEGLEPFRVMDDPLSVGDPAYYNGTSWVDGANVHTNSSIGNLVFVMLSEGRVGLTEEDEPIDVTGIGLVEAAKFLFFVNRNYLTPSSNYRDYANGCLLAGEEYFSGDAASISNVEAAWKAVGLLKESQDDFFDLSISANSETVNCGRDTFVDISFTVANTGTLPYLAEEEAVVVVFQDNQRVVEIILDQDIPAGEEFSRTVEEVVYLDRGFINVIYELEIGNVTIGETSEFFRTTEHVAEDLSLVTTVQERACFSDSVAIEFRVENVSCSPLDAGAEILLEIEGASDGIVFYQEDVTTPDRLGSNGSWVFERTLNFETTDPVGYFTSIVYPPDPDTESNVSSFVVAQALEINAGYYNGFNSFVDFQPESQLEIKSTGFHDNNYRYQNMSQFMATGFFDEARGPLCFDSDDNWGFNEQDIFGSVTSQIRTCLNLEEMMQPAVRFNLVQFRHQFPEFQSEESASLRFIWEENDEEMSIVIQGQEEGLIEENVIGLPAQYRGPLRFEFLTQTGTIENNSDFLEYDVVLMDDLIIFNDMSSTTEQDHQLSFSMTPNPVNESLQVVSNNPIASVAILNMQGQIVGQKTVSINNKITVNVATLLPGTYSLRLTSDNGYVEQQLFVKM